MSSYIRSEGLHPSQQSKKENNDQRTLIEVLGVSGEMMRLMIRYDVFLTQPLRLRVLRTPRSAKRLVRWVEPMKLKMCHNVGRARIERKVLR